MVTVSPARAASITGARNWDDMREQYPGHVDAMAGGLMRGDALADAVVAEFFSGAGLGWAETIGALDTPHDVDGLPPALTKFLTRATTPPSWFDPALARAGADAWWRFGSLQSSTLYQSLIYGYQARGFTRPLAETGRLTDGTWDRVYATARWVALATAPDQMDIGAPGWVETARIRLVHAMVRHHLIQRQDWDVKAWGVPINQTYSQFTITAGFLAIPLKVGKDFGLRYSPAEREAITHLWRWIGWVMGVDDKLLPTSYADAETIYRIATDFRMEPDESGKALVKALLHDGYTADLGLPGPLNSAVYSLARPFLKPFFATLSSRWMEPEMAEALGLRPSRLNNLVVLARPVVRSREVLRSMGLLGSDHTVARRELRMVTSRLGLDLAHPELGKRYRKADSGDLETAS
ncbi:MAG: oxygenase MpaB family protein [Gordonia sp. (in: high G+C Gram-positive bacteria)]|uniref:oxygenase MpaB family protein n=1 Tax=Gordonia sp. (in: high G+C Gram-positive bacteria) TaxID=84139 RepID=UPI0039E4D091